MLAETIDEIKELAESNDVDDEIIEVAKVLARRQKDDYEKADVLAAVSLQEALLERA